MTDAPDLPKPLLVFIALLQGLLLLLLHEAVEFGYWPAGQPSWQYATFTAVLVGPTFLLLSLDTTNLRPLLRWTAPFTLLAAALGYYVGSQQLLQDGSRTTTLSFVFAVTMSIACFKALLYVQQFAAGKRFDYAELFERSWRNFLTQACALLFTALFWGILLLWGALFGVIGIRFFRTLFGNEWFLYPALAMAHGFGIAIFRTQERVFDVVARVNQALMKFLLVMLVLVAVAFLCALPFTGLAPLWATRSGSALILWLQALLLLFLNGVYQDAASKSDGTSPSPRRIDVAPYAPSLHRFVYVGIALLPVYSAIAFYGLYLRIDQYGWTLERCWAIVVWTVLALFSLGYLLAIVRLRDGWTARLGSVNVAIGVLLMVVLLASNSPLLDFRRIVVASQLARLDSGALTLREFDFSYFRYQLGRPGFDALQALKQRAATTDPDIVLQIDDLYRPAGKRASPRNDADSLRRRLLVSPAGAQLPSTLLDEVARWSNDRASLRVTHTSVFVVDLDRDGRDEYLVTTRLDTLRIAALFVPATNGWQRIDILLKGAADDAALAASIERGEVRVVEPRWQELHVGELRMRVQGE